MVYVVITERVIKFNTHATAKFAARSENTIRLNASGPFLSFKAAQRAVLTCLGTHTCLDAKVWTEEQIVDALKRPHSLRHEMNTILIEAQKMLMNTPSTVS